MELDDKLKWVETRVISSLRPRNEDIKNMFQNDENRLVFHEFMNNEDIRRLFVYIRPPRQLVASLQPPHDFSTKSVFFLKNNTGVKLTKENIDEEVLYLDCSDNALHQLDLVTKEIYLPLLCSDPSHSQDYGISTDRIMDILHRLTATVETTQGHIQGEILLPLPSIEVLAEAAANSNRRGAVLHVLEGTVISWIRQIKSILKHDSLSELEEQAGPFPGPLAEVELWQVRLEKLNSINQQLDSTVASDILRNLEEANSTYAHSFRNVRKDIEKAILETEENQKFLSTMESWFEELHSCLNPQHLLKLFQPLIHVMLLVWTHSRYYHQKERFASLLRLVSNEVVHRAEAMIGEDILYEPLESYSKLKEALRVCAAFRGTFLDYRDKADEINQKNQQEYTEIMSAHPKGPQTLFKSKRYGSYTFKPKYVLSLGSGDDHDAPQEEELLEDSPWPPRNAPAFDLLNAFMERCNDVLELVQTTRHFRLLEDAANIGGAGSQSLDALVREVHVKYKQAMDVFFSQVSNVLAIDGTQAFEKAFFRFRIVVKDLEIKLSDILRQSFQQCPTIGSQLRLLEVFEGISSRELVQAKLHDKDQQLVESFTTEVQQVQAVFHRHKDAPPLHPNMPPVVGKLQWIYALKERVEGPIRKMRKVSPHSLEGDLGWHLREAYSECMQELDSYEIQAVARWQTDITAELTERLKQPLLVADDYNEEEELRPLTVHVNLDPKLLMLMREIHYLAQEPFNIKLPIPAREMVRNTSSLDLRTTATRLETIVSKYNAVMKSITEYERPLFERSLSKIDVLFEQGLNQFTWRTEESADFIETATAVVCLDLHANLDVVQTNCQEIAQTTLSWSKGMLDIFSARDMDKSYTIDTLVSIQKDLDDKFEVMVTPTGNRIHSLLRKSFEAVHISAASPAWQDYVDYVDAIVLEGLKQASLTSLRAMLNNMVQANMAQGSIVPILTIRVELINNEVAFRPPLDEGSSNTSVREIVGDWLSGFLARGRLVKMLGGKSSYEEYITADEEIQQLLEHIYRVVNENAEECKNMLVLFGDYEFLWQQDVVQTFQEFLQGNVSPNPLRNTSRVTTGPSNLRMIASARSSRVSSAKSKSSIESAGLVGTAERTFLTPKQSQMENTNVPSLDEFDAEVDIYRMAHEEIQSLQDYEDMGWLRVDLQPVKQVLTTYASKWMWTFIKYLSDQVTSMLEAFDEFLKRVEPEIEGITGEERDTASFMKMMRLFNEVSAQQTEMDGKFAAMHRTVLLIKKYGQQLPENTQTLFDAAPGRWSSLKTKVSLAKQRLGPRIQAESERISQDLAHFGKRVQSLFDELVNSEVYSREFSLSDAWVTIDNFEQSLDVLEDEAQDLIELQDLLEASVVNFSLLPQCRNDLNGLKEVWETVRVIDEQQSDWKRHRWQKMNTKFLREETAQQLEMVNDMSDDVVTWDVYMGLQDSITNIQACLPLIDDLSNPAMRTRHWKQLVRVTGGAVQIDNDTLKRMTLGELLSLGLQSHVDDVRAIVQRAVKDLTIEKSLKTYEEVWLSKIFELREHVRNRMIHSGSSTQPDSVRDNHSEVSHHSEAQQTATGVNRSHMRTTSRVSNQSSLARARRASAASLPQSLINLGEDNGLLSLLTNTEPIFEELESHQVSLQAMQSNSAAGSFLDEVIKWQKRLQTIEAVLTVWLEVQSQWLELEEIYFFEDVKIALPYDSNLFATLNRDFRLLMRATEKNPNVLQCCQRKNVLEILQKMNSNLELCHKSILSFLENRRQNFPRLYFLSIEDVMHIVCNGYDLSQVNLYIGKLFENVGSVVYEDAPNSDISAFQIVGVLSALGEKLPFAQPLVCEGQIESWLPYFLSEIKLALQYQLASALGVEQPKQKRIRSAGARKVTMPDSDKNSVNKKGAYDAKPRRQYLFRKAQELPESHDGASVHNHQDQDQGKNHRSWTFDHVTEVVYLATQVMVTQQIKNALAELDGGNKDAVKNALTKLSDSLKTNMIMLKGMENKSEAEGQKTTVQESIPQQDKTDSLSESSRVQKSPHNLSQHSSTADVNNTNIAEDDVRSGDAQSLNEPATNGPVDTMTIGAPLMIVKKEESDGGEGETSQTEQNVVLLPSQIRKISNLIALLAHKRELLQRIQTQVEQSLGSRTTFSDAFDWCSQLQYVFSSEDRVVQVKCLEVELEYGFEYLGSSDHEVITPLTEKVYVSLLQAINTHKGGLCMGPAGSGRLSTVQELSRAAGRPFYNFNCTSSTKVSLLTDVFKGLAVTGSWICLSNINLIPAEVLSLCAQLLADIFEAKRSSKGSVHISDEELTLSQDGTCFALIDSGIPIVAGNPEKLLSFGSAVSRLPSTLLSQFRTVSMVTPDITLLMEVLLASQGFETAAELAHQSALLFEMCHALLGTNAAITINTKHLAFNSSDAKDGCSSQLLKYVTSEAGVILSKLISQRLAKQGNEFDIIIEEDSQENTEEGEEKKLADKDFCYDEKKAFVTALWNTLLPRLLGRDADIFGSLFRDMWPDVEVLQAFEHVERDQVSVLSHTREKSHGSRVGSRAGSRPATRTLDSRNAHTPVMQLLPLPGNQPDKGEMQLLTDISDAIASATGKLGLVHGISFQARVSQLAQLNAVHKTIIVAGPSGCGKSECIKTFALAERERGKTITVHSVFTKSLESSELLGYLDPTSKEWHAGLVPSILKKFFGQHFNADDNPNLKEVMKILQLDGELDSNQLELMESVLHNNGSVVLGNNERIVLPNTLRFIWETETTGSLSPSLLASVGVLCMSPDDVTWRMVLSAWVNKRPEGLRELLHQLCDQYVPTIVEYLQQTTKSPVISKPDRKGPYFRRVIPQPDGAIINTFTMLLETLINPFPELTDLEVERRFNFAAVWAFGGTLEPKDQDSFGQWWRETFENYIDYPEEGTVFDYMVDAESHGFVKWADTIPSYTGSPHCGIPGDAFVHTVNTEQLLYLLGLLSDHGKPVMLVGEWGCGKSSVVNERIRTVCSGEVAEVLAVTINTNRFTNAKLLHQRLDERLEWKHGRTYVPRGNKKLMCFVDDLNLAQVDQYGSQTALEMVRQHIDDGGFYDPDSDAWRYVKNVTYVTTVNPNPTANVPKLSNRLLRHFAIFNCPYPGNSELQTVFGTLLHTHFLTPEMSSSSVLGSTAQHLGIHDEKEQNVMRAEEEAMKSLLSLVVKVTLELQERLRTMFLPTSERCHYLFTMKDLGVIFRNLCLSLQPGCSKETLLLLWEHECGWVYGHRMVTEVDTSRFKQAFITAVRKEFNDEEHIQLLSQKEKPIFSNLIEQDSGLVTAGNFLGSMHHSQIETDNETDRFGPTYDVAYVRTLMERGLEEYNKAHPRIKMSFYRSVIENVCRLSRMMASPHEVAHSILLCDGCPARTAIMAYLAAQLSGFTIFKINPSIIANSGDYEMDVFKADLVAGFTRAGVKGEHVLFVLEEDEIVEEDFLVPVMEFIVSGAISHLFTFEEMTTIINSIRSEVTQAGLTYTRDVAWNYFLNSVKKNFRVCLILSGAGVVFQHRCRQYPGLLSNVNIINFPHWSKRQLIKHAAYHLRGLKWMDAVSRENICHLVATMHMVLQLQNDALPAAGRPRHVTNTTYERFIERFITMAEAHYAKIQEQHQQLVKMCTQIQQENKLASKLNKQLEHEKVVLEERKASTVQILSQIGQDTAITEQQMRIVKVQMDKIQRLKKLLPEYQVNHERAVYKAIAIVADTKKIVQNLNMKDLAELRAMQKPIIDIEDLMAAVIMILKNPQADLTWQKGAKRQMANLERLIEELVTFDDNVLPEATLVLVEPYLKKPSFEPENMEKKTSNSACASLCRWVHGVCRYNRMMISKVKPLHKKVEETTQAIDHAQHKMSALESKRKTLEVRLAGLAKGFEEATIDKNNQKEKTINMDTMLETAARLRKVLRKELQRVQQIIDSLPQREASLPGCVSMAAAFATYLGAYHYNFRRLMLTVHWPHCLQERGVPLIMDSIDEVRGRIVDFSMNQVRTASGASDTEMSDTNSFPAQEIDEYPPNEDDEEEEQEGDNDEQKDAEDADENQQQAENKDMNQDEKGDTEDMEKGEKEETEQEFSNKDEDERSKKEMEELDHGDEEEEDGEMMDIAEQPASSQGSQPDALSMMSADQYNNYVKALVKLLMGRVVLQEWIHKDFALHKLENAAVLCSSWQRPPLLIDPYREGTNYLHWLNKTMNKQQLVTIHMDTRSDPQVTMAIERAITKGQPILLDKCSEQIDCMVAPLIHHCNTSLRDQTLEEPRMVKFCGRRILCHPDFRLYLSTSNPQPCLSTTVVSTSAVINFGSSNETLVDDFLMRAFARVRPELYQERRHALDNIHANQKAMLMLYQHFKEHVTRNHNYIKEQVFKKEVDKLADLTDKKNEMHQHIKDMQHLMKQHDCLRDELFPLARRATLLFALLRSLACIHQEYQFTLPYFLQMFDHAVGGELPPEFFKMNEEEAETSEPEKQMGTDQDLTETTKQSDMGEVANLEEQQEGEAKILANQEGMIENQVPDSSTENTEEVMQIPEMIPLPSEGIDYSSLPDNQIKQLIDRLTSTVYSRIQSSLYEEHRLLFAGLLCVTIEEDGGQKVTEEEVSLLLQGNPGLGMQLTLADFNCNEAVPSWLPADKWDDVLALSVLPGPLDSLCVHIASNSDVWQSWYKSAKPEEEALPLADKAEDEEDRPETASPDLGPLSEFHQLLLIRMLRPDRLPLSMARYVSRHLSLNLEDQSTLDLQELLANVKNGHTGVLVLLPPSDSNSDPGVASSFQMAQSVLDVLRKLAQSRGVSIETMTVFDGCESQVLDAVSAADTNDTWVAIDNINLASSKLCHELQICLSNISKGKTASSNFCVWLTSEPTGNLPVEFLNTLYKVSWNSLQQVAAGSETGSQQGVQDKEQEESQESEKQLMCGSPGNALTRALSTTFSLVPKEHWQRLAEKSQAIRSAAFGICVIHAVLVVRQGYGTRGLSQTYPLSGAQITQSLDLLCSPVVCGEQGAEPNVEVLCRVITELVYSQLMCSVWDVRYVSTLVRHVLCSLLENQSGTLDLGRLQIPTPPANVDPADFSTWFKEKTQGQLATTEALLLSENVERAANDAMSVKFLQLLDRLYEAQNMDLGEIKSKITPEVNALHLRAVLDDILHHLPSLLELGDVPEISLANACDFPYHRPSILSQATAESAVMPESVGFVLLQECLWMNKLLCHIREHVYAIHQRLLSGPESFPMDMEDMVQSLVREHVPVAWVHPNCQPSTHTLSSWQEDLKKRYQQMQKWIKHGMVPVYQESQSAPVSHGRLRSVWLGGLVNPCALITAMCKEKALTSNCHIDQVELEATVSTSFEVDTYPGDRETGLFVHDLYLQGATWDMGKKSLAFASQDLNVLPSVYVCPVLKMPPSTRTGEQETSDIDPATEVFNCSVFMNRACQLVQFALPLRCSEPSQTWTLAGTALILDPGVPEDSSKKPRAFNYRSIAGSGVSEDATAPTHQSVQISSPGGAKQDGPATHRSRQSLSQPSSHSQMSYKPMSPKASPLPPELSMTREKPMQQDVGSVSGQSQLSENQQSTTQSNQSARSQSPGSGSKGTGNASSDHYSSKDSIAVSDKSRGSKASKDSVGKQSSTSKSSRGSRKSVQHRKQGDPYASQQSLGQQSIKSQGSKQSKQSERKQTNSAKSKQSDSESVQSAGNQSDSKKQSILDSPRSEKSDDSRQSTVKSEVGGEEDSIAKLEPEHEDNVDLQGEEDNVGDDSIEEPTYPVPTEQAKGSDSDRD